MNRRKRIYLKGLAWVAFLCYMTVLIYFLFFSENYGRVSSNKEFRYNLTLFAEIRRFIRYRNAVGFGSFFINVVGNVLAFVPFGFVLPILHKSNRNFWYVLVTGFEFSLLVELVQLTARVGIFDVDDVFLNTLGTVVGYGFYAIAHQVYRRSADKEGANVSEKGNPR